MLDLNSLLDNAQKMCSPANNNGLAAALNVKPSAVSNWRHGRAYPDALSCDKLAQMVGIAPLRLIAQVNELRAISREEKALWKRLASAAAVMLLVGATTLPGQARASGQQAGSAVISHIAAHTAYYVNKEVHQYPLQAVRTAASSLLRSSNVRRRPSFSRLALRWRLACPQASGARLAAVERTSLPRAFGLR